MSPTRYDSATITSLKIEIGVRGIDTRPDKHKEIWVKTVSRLLVMEIDIAQEWLQLLRGRADDGRFVVYGSILQYAETTSSLTVVISRALSRLLIRLSIIEVHYPPETLSRFIQTFYGLP